MMFTPQRYHCSADFKLSVVKYAETHTNCDTGKHFNVHESCVRRWKRNKNLLESCSSNRKSFSGPKQGHYPELEAELAHFVVTNTSVGQPISPRDVREKAMEIARLKNIPLDSFKASRNWFGKFMRRSGLVLNRKRCGRRKAQEYDEGLHLDSRKKEEPAGLLEAPLRVRSPSKKRTIKKPKMDQFITFSDSSGLEDHADNSSNYELSNESADETGVNLSPEYKPYSAPQLRLKEPCQQMKFDGSDLKDPWSASTIPDEVTIDEVKPMLEVYLETNLQDSQNPLEESPQNPFVGSTSEAENMANTVTMHAVTDNVDDGHLVYEVDNVYLDNGKSSEQKDVADGSLHDYTLMWIEKKMKSPVWKHFKRFTADNATCNYCSAVLKTPKGSTSSMARHLLMHFKDKKGERTLIDNYDDHSDPRKPYAVHLPHKKDPVDDMRARELTERIAYMLAKDCLPVSIVDGEGFRSLIKDLEPSYELPSSRKFKDEVIPQLYVKAVDKARRKLDSSLKDAATFALSADTWDSCDGTGYVSFTCHRMTEEFEIERHFVGVTHFPGKKSGADLRVELLRMFEELGMKDQEAKVCVVTEKAQEMQADMQEGRWTAVPCFARNLQLAADDAKAALPGFSQLRRKCRDVMTRYQSRGAARDRLVALRNGECVEEEGSADLGKWDEDFNAFQYFSERCGEIRRDLKAQGVVEELSETDWKCVKAIVDILTPIDQAMKDFCVDSYPPLSMTIPIIYGIEHMLDDKEELFAKNLSNAMKARFPSYKTNKAPLLAMILDPRYKAVILTEEEVNLVTKMVTDEISESFESKETSEVAEDSSGIGDENPVKKSCSLWSAFEKITKEQPAPSEKKMATYQVKQYLDQPVMPRSGNPYKWWKENREKYNLLVPLALRYLAIPATQIASSVLLSTENSALARRRGNLESSNAEQLVYLHENFCPEKLLFS